ncbi:tripartite tricarboxylate transporter TctB family protein [Colidextribacter sp. OB.20]|uniref:tripartite tricarboxylate transporter TctB family protein n=1 Tax=Colidextribacter sp. OB.20 TaxID=2304568 RepID=UPI0013687550|nr:tripartite tricarboxylate transporter TctB family protein [Colidextribacter sp. OB.20]NBI11809.1 tripartite tricarboxylate transporter TctB family protein [Colidextribacter sp. OB.20]
MSKWVEQFNGRMDAWGRKLHEKEIRIPIDLVTGVVFFLVGLGVLLVMPDQVAISEKDVVNGRAFPTMLTVVMLLCCAMLIGKELYKLVTKQPLNWKVINIQVEIKALVILGILVLTYLLSKLTGLFVVGAIFCCLGFLLYFRCRKKSYYVITLVMAVAIWAAFRFALGVDF